jgi:hypothetical protein
MPVQLSDLELGGMFNMERIIDLDPNKTRMTTLARGGEDGEIIARHYILAHEGEEITSITLDGNPTDIYPWEDRYALAQERLRGRA